jgi:GntR family transcriptional repressor for pyruvate dehydrogenase complex
MKRTPSTMLQHAKKVTLFDDVVLQVQNLIHEGSLRPGDRLPPERELALQLGVSRNTLREALKALKLIGVLEVSQGGGTFVNESLNSNLFASSTKFMSLVETTEILNLVEARKAIESATTFYAAERADLSDMDKMEKFMILTKDNYKDTELFTKYDSQFHLQIATASKNPFLVNLLKAIREPLLREMVKTHLSLPPFTAVQDHANIFNFIKAKDSKRSAEAMNLHLEKIEAIVRASFQGK